VGRPHPQRRERHRDVRADKPVGKKVIGDVTSVTQSINQSISFASADLMGHNFSVLRIRLELNFGIYVIVQDRWQRYNISKHEYYWCNLYTTS
jgi:hypothetical protein